MKPIGGYFELERGTFTPLHDGVYVNTGCSALRLIVRLLKITRIHVPNYTCPVVHKTLASEGCTLVPYDLDARLMPDRTFPKDDFILANDYFGLTGGNIAQLAADYPNLIVDNAQSYFANPLGRATIYSPRKFMGLPDGGVAVFNKDGVNNSTIPNSSFQLPTSLQPSTSYSHASHLLKRHDLGASEAYADFKANDDSLFNQPLCAMSNLTHALMSTINESEIRTRRLANFSYLFNRLKTDFPINPLPESAPLVYPYITRDPTLRQRLIAAQIFVATYWPGCAHSDSLVNTILPLPIDQRYDSSDMNRILEEINT